MEELKLENAEFIENQDLPIEDKIKIRLQELQEMRAKIVEALKRQQENALSPIDAAITELTNLLPKQD